MSRKKTVDNISSEPGNDPVRICYLTSIISDEHAGTEGHLIRLVRSLDRRRFDPHLLCLQDSTFVTQWNRPQVPMSSLGYKAMYRPSDWLRVWRLSRWLKKERYRIVELHSPEAQFIGCLAARMAGVHVVIACRRSLGYNFDRKARAQIAITKGMVDCFLANSQVVVERMSELGRIGKSRFELIYNGVDLEQFDQDKRQPCCTEFEDACEQSILVTISANLRPVKNHTMFLRAAKTVADQRDSVSFVLLGAGAEEAALKVLARELGIEHRVLFSGAKVPVAPYLYRSAIGCLTSDSEGFSNAIVEYMTAELPVVATNVGGAAEAILDGETGYLVPTDDDGALADRLLRIIDDEKLRQNMGRNGRKRVELKFNLQSQVNEYEALYENLLNAARQN